MALRAFVSGRDVLASRLTGFGKNLAKQYCALLVTMGF